MNVTQFQNRLHYQSTLLQYSFLIRRLFLAFSGVKPEKLEEGLLPRHCALSLVGEPIMYPEINAVVDELHHRHISTFLVTNAQFPEKIKTLKPITQVFSIDLHHAQICYLKDQYNNF
jgi:wyosine [tRNA(Phe)-imidazoG37] synthetase (radical SAM superfamily)